MSGWLRSRVRQWLPDAWMAAMRKQMRRARHWGLRHWCNACGSRLRAFLPHPSGEQDFLCPVCGSKPPHRLAMYFLQERAELFVGGGQMLHIAPEPGLRPRLARMCERVGMAYRPGGLTGEGAEHLDLLDLPFADACVDLMYCCHVLNCMPDDRAAMREVRRVMSRQGTALLQVPAFNVGVETIETTTREQRIAAFNDDGIHRCYTDADYQQRLRASGFLVTVYRAEALPPGDVARLSLKREVLHVCQPDGPR